MSRLAIYLYSSLLFFLMSWVYVFYMFPLFEYAGFKLNVGYNELLISFLLLVFCLLFIGDDFKSNYYFIFLILSVVPSLVIFSVGGASMSFIFITIYSYLLVVLSSKFKVPFFKLFSFDIDVLIKIFAASSSLYIIGIFAQGGYKYLNFNIFSVYDFRSDAADNLIGLYGYLSPIFGKVVIPVLIALSLFTKKYIYLMLGVVFSVLVFSLTSHKSPLIYPLIIILIYYIVNKFFNFKVLFLIVLILLSVYSAFDFYLMMNTSEGAFGSFFFRRALILPAYLNYLYIDFFSINDFYYWANSKFSFGLITTEYQYSAAYQIGSEYFGNPESGANTGLVGSGYSNFGIFGVTIYSILTGLLISYFYASSKVIGAKEVFSYSFILFLTIILSTDLSTALLTHGLLGLLFTLSIHPPEERSEFN